MRQEVQSQQEAQSQEFVSKANIGLEWRHRDIRQKVIAKLLLALISFMGHADEKGL